MIARTGKCVPLVMGLIGVLFAGPAAAQMEQELVDLQAVEYSCQDGAARLRIQGTGELTYDVFMMEDPPRVVLDLVGVSAPREVELPEGDPVLRALRSALWRDRPEESIVRYVLETHGSPCFEVDRSEGGLTLVVQSVVSAGAGPYMSARSEEAGSDWGSLLVPMDEALASDAVPAEVAPAMGLMESSESPLADAEAQTQAEDVWVASRPGDAQPESSSPPPPSMALPVEEDLPTTVSQQPYDPYYKVIARHLPAAAQRAAQEWGRDRPRHNETPPFGDQGGSFGQHGSSLPSMSLDVQGSDIHTVLRAVAEYAGVNIVADHNVRGAITLRALDMPWDDMLRAICRAMGLVALDHGTVIRIATERTAQDESLARDSAARKQEDLMPIETRIIPLHYANADELKTVVDAMRTSRGSVEVDDRTNSLILSDIAPRLEKVASTLRDLDSQTLQVEITAELVDVDASVSRQLGIAWGATNLHSYSNNASGSAGVSAGDLLDPVGSMQVGVLRSFGEIQAQIEALATDNKADIISTPRITTVNNRQARILVGKEVPIITMDEAGNAITELKKVGITLEVTPYVNSNEQITLDIHPEISDLSQESTVQGGVVFNTTEADTRVMVQDGETAVIGGLLNTRKTEFVRGVPILKDIPLLGYLFRSTDERDQKRELLIFVTPRIVRPRER